MGILQARMLEWVAMPSSRGSSWPRDRTHVSYISSTGGGFYITSSTWKANIVLSFSVSRFDPCQLQLVYLTMEHHPVRNLQHETSQTTFDEFSQSQHLLHTLLWSIFVFQFCFYLSWINNAFCCSVAKSCPTAIPLTAVHQSFTISEFAQLLSIESVMLSNHLILCGPHFLLLSMFPSIRVFSNESDLCIKWPKYWSFSISPSNRYSELISLQARELSRVFSSTTIQKHQFFSVQPSLWCNSYICTWLLLKAVAWLFGPLLAKWCLSLLMHCLGLSELFFQGAGVF